MGCHTLPFAREQLPDPFVQNLTSTVEQLFSQSYVVVDQFLDLPHTAKLVEEVPDRGVGNASLNPSAGLAMPNFVNSSSLNRYNLSTGAFLQICINVQLRRPIPIRRLTFDVYHPVYLPFLDISSNEPTILESPNWLEIPPIIPCQLRILLPFMGLISQC